MPRSFGFFAIEISVILSNTQITSIYDRVQILTMYHYRYSFFWKKRLAFDCKGYKSNFGNCFPIQFQLNMR
jgi:hypothetical protein